MDESGPPRPANVPPGYDEENPYEGETLTAYPGWWRRNVEEFREHRMRPYRPSKLADGTITTLLIGRLEEELDVDIDLRAVDPQAGGDWTIRVDGQEVASVDRVRTELGNSRFDISEQAFEELVRAAAETRD